jgi:hypothetical protein
MTVKPSVLLCLASVLFALNSCQSSAPSPDPSAISYTVDDAPIPGNAKPQTGNIAAADVTDLHAYVNKMPTIGTPRTPLIATFTISMPTPCHYPVLVRSDDKGLGTYRVLVTLARVPGACTANVTSKRVRYEDPTFMGPFKTFSLELAGGESAETEIGEVH